LTLGPPTTTAVADAPPLVVSTVAGTSTGGFSGDDGPAIAAQLQDPEDVAVDHQGNVVIVDSQNERLRVLAESSSTFYGQSMTAGDIYTVAGNGTLGYTGDGGPALSAELDDPEDVVVDPAGNLVVADSQNCAIRVVAEATGTFYGTAMTAGDIYTVAGCRVQGGGFADPSGVALDAAGNLVVANTLGPTIKVVAESTGTYYGIAMTAGQAYTVAGRPGLGGYTGDGGPATSAELATPVGVSVDQQGNLVIADTGNYVIRVVAESTGTFYGVAMTQGDIYTVAGDGTGGDAGDGGPATVAWLAAPSGVAVDSQGNLLFADDNNSVRMVAEATGTFYGQNVTAGEITTIAGTGILGFNDNVAASAAQFTDPEMVAVNASGDLFVADPGNARVREILPALYDVAITAGNDQSAAAGTAFPTNLSVTVTDAATGDPAPGVAVTFSAEPYLDTGASAVQADGAPSETVTTDGSGAATADPFYAYGPGASSPTPFTIEASMFGGDGATFDLDVTQNTSTTMAVAAGNNQSVVEGSPFPTDLAVTVTRGGQPVVGEQVIFSINSFRPACAFFANGQQPDPDLEEGFAVTNASGVATAPTLTPQDVPGCPGALTVQASTWDGGGTSFSLTVTSNGAAHVNVVAGDNQATTVGTPFPTDFEVQVTTASGQPVPNAAITFEAPVTSPTGRFPGPDGGVDGATVSTDGNGDAVAPVFTAGGTAGSYVVDAWSNDVASPGVFHLENEGPPASVVATVGTPQSAHAGTAFPIDLAARVTDSAGDPVAGVSVMFSAPTSGATGTFPGSASSVTETTSSTGTATAPTFTAGSTVGSYQVTGTVAGVSTPAVFALTNTNTPANIVASAGTPQSTVRGYPFGTDLAALVTDGASDPCQGVSVTFSAPPTGTAGTFPGAVTSVTVLTGANGVATAPTFTANSTVGPYQVLATVSGLPTPATFSLTNTVGAALVATESVLRNSKGGKLRLGLTATNGGPDTAPNVTLTDVIVSPGLISVAVPKGCQSVAPPPGDNAEVTCTKSKLTNGKAATFKITVTGHPGGAITSTLETTSTTPDPNPAAGTTTLTATYG